MMPNNDPENLEQPEDAVLAATREVAKMISDFRQEVMDKLRADMDRDIEEMESKGFDPARGRGRGPFWADGG